MRLCISVPLMLIILNLTIMDLHVNYTPILPVQSEDTQMFLFTGIKPIKYSHIILFSFTTNYFLPSQPQLIIFLRLLSASIDVESIPDRMISKSYLTKITERMNMRNRMARNASRASSDYHQYLFFKGK
jgi:hypothetical protein